MVNQNFFRQKDAKLSKQHVLAIVVKPMGLGIWARKIRSSWELTCSCSEDESKMKQGGERMSDDDDDGENEIVFNGIKSKSNSGVRSKTNMAGIIFR